MSAYDLGHAHANTFWGAGPACVRPGWIVADVRAADAVSVAATVSLV